MTDVHVNRHTQEEKPETTCGHEDITPWTALRGEAKKEEALSYSP